MFGTTSNCECLPIRHTGNNLIWELHCGTVYKNTVKTVFGLHTDMLVTLCNHHYTLFVETLIHCIEFKPQKKVMLKKVPLEARCENNK